MPKRTCFVEYITRDCLANITSVFGNDVLEPVCLMSKQWKRCYHGRQHRQVLMAYTQLSMSGWI